MIFHETRLQGAFIIEPEVLKDNRGFFARTWCQREFRNNGLNPRLAQCNISFNEHRGTLRGMHFQKVPYEEAKLIRCSRGAIYDVIIDLRSMSSTFKQYVATELSADNCRMVYAPEGFAHGFLTLADQSEVFYQMSEFFSPDHSTGVRWDDPVFSIHWPIKVQLISERDASYPDFAR